MSTRTTRTRSGPTSTFDLLLAGYSDRWQRNLRRTLELLEDGLHPAGVALVMCDRRILSSDPQDWDELISEAAGAEKYSCRLSERITDGYAAKFDRHDDPGGHAGLGFRRLPEPPHTLEIDPDRMPIALGLFERYALGNVSAKELADENGFAESGIRMILMNPLYNGWVRRYRRTERETLKPAPWRSNPPVSDELWARVEDVRRARTRGGDRETVTGSTSSAGCSRASAVGGSATTGRSPMAATASNTPPVRGLGPQGSPRRRDVGGTHAGLGRRHHPRPGHRITVAGPVIVGVRLTQAAYAHRLALALPEKVEMARPTGVERADATTIRIPIEGADIGVRAEGAWSRATPG